MRAIFVLVLSVLAVLVAEDADLRAETAGNDFGWSAEFDAAMAFFENGDAATAVLRLTPLADAGDAQAQFLLGRFYGEGVGVAEDDCRSLEWFRLAATNEHTRAIEAVGLAYESGWCVEPNIDTAVQDYERAAALGNARAAFTLASLFMSTDWKRHDFGAAFDFAEMAWEMRSRSEDLDIYSIRAAWLMGALYQTGNGVPESFEKAEKYLRPGANHGFPQAQFSLGKLYIRSGRYSRALEGVMWILVAAKLGDKRAIELQDELLHELNDQDAARARDTAVMEFRNIVRSPRLVLGKAAKWCRTHHPGSDECVRFAIVDHYTCNPEISEAYLNQRYVKSVSYDMCRSKALEVRAVGSGQ